jgi:hypothetical protein
MTPIVSATKPAATAIATFDSIDNFITFPFCYCGACCCPVFIASFLIGSNLSVLADVGALTDVAEVPDTLECVCADNLLGQMGL